MTEQQTQTYAQVGAETGSRLAQMHAAYADAKAEVEGAAERLKVITDAIKLELTNAAPDQARIELHGPGPTLRLVYTTSWRVDAKKLKAEAPEIYVRYAKQTGSWTLKAAAAGGASE